MSRHLSVGARILAGYGIVLLIVGVIGVISYQATDELVESSASLTKSHRIKEAIVELVSRVKDAETGQRGFLLTGQEKYLEPYTKAIPEIDRGINTLRGLTADYPEQQRNLDAAKSLIDEKLAELAETISLRRQKGERAAVEVVLTDRGKTLMDDLRKELGVLDSSTDQVLALRDKNTRSVAIFAKSCMVLGGVFVVVLVLVVGFGVRRSILRPLSVFMGFADRVGQGDLTQKSEMSRGDELGELAGRLDLMVVGLREVAGQAQTATKDLHSAAAEILASTQQQASGTNEQAAAIQQTTSTMEEVTRAGVQISERAKQVVTSAESVVKASRTGIAAVENTNRTMNAIQEQAGLVAEKIVTLSEKTQLIGEIISAVDDLSQQSHLLSLNAAIEAAAAGEHGRPFSVIAGEMKNLADQSKAATVQVRSVLEQIQKEINSSVMLTEEAVKRVENGKAQADVADRTIRDMAQTVEFSVQAFQQIAAGSGQQQVGFGQVNQAIRNIAQVSQQSASSTQQLEKAAFSLTALAQQLQTSVSRYRL